MSVQHAVAKKSSAQLPPISPWLLRGFLGYVRYYLRRHFQGYHLLHASKAAGLEEWPLLICTNHPGWWDPLLALDISQRFFPHREHRGPIAEEGLAKFRFFERLGFFGIDPRTREGAAEFLRIGKAVLHRADGAFWISAQGRFTDVRVRPVELQAGLAHLARLTPRLVFLPIAFEYAFWVDRKPEAFACVGDPILIEDGARCRPEEWRNIFARALEETQSTLSEQVQTRNVDAFDTVFHTRPGTGGIYDLWQALKSIAGARPLRSESRVSLK